MADVTIKMHSKKQWEAVTSDKKILLLATGTQWGKGLPLDSLVLTPNGYVSAGTIQKGDVLIDRDGKQTEVDGVFSQGQQDCYEIVFRDNKKLITDGSHLNVVIPRCGRKERVLSTESLYFSKHLFGIARIPSVKPIHLKARKFSIEPYTIGVLIGDGGITDCVTVSSCDKQILSRISRELPPHLKLVKVSGANCDYRIVNKKRTHNRRGYLENTYIDSLGELGLFGLKSHEKFIPHEYKFSSVKQRLDLLRGLMDTDGTVTNDEGSKTSRKIEFYSTSKTLANDVVWLVESLGGKAWVLEKQGWYRRGNEKITCKMCYRVNIISPLFNPFFLKRKARKHFKHNHTTDKIIDRVEKIGKKETVCFSVASKTKTFIANDQIVTHNTTVGAIRMKQKMHEHAGKESAFIITAPTYKTLHQSTLPAFLKLMDGYGRYDKKFDLFKFSGGGTVYCRTETDPDSVVGITNVKHIWCDEAGKYGLYFWQNIQARAEFCGCAIDLTTSPYSLNWIYKEIIKPCSKGERPDVEYVTAASWDNPYHSLANEENRALKERTMDSRRFRMIFGGMFEKMEGLVYDCFDEAIHVVEPFQLPTGTRYFAGIDWGFYPDPFVIIIRAVLPNGKHIQVGEFVKTKLTISDQIQAAKQKRTIWNIERFYADPSQPGSIEEFNRAGLPTVPAENAIRIGIDAHYELIKSGDFRIFKNSSPNTLDEYATYHYADVVDLKPDQDSNPKDQLPVGQFDHCLDASRYLTSALRLGLTKRTPIAPVDLQKARESQDNEKRIAALKKIPKKNIEEWT